MFTSFSSAAAAEVSSLVIVVALSFPAALVDVNLLNVHGYSRSCLSSLHQTENIKKGFDVLFNIHYFITIITSVISELSSTIETI